MHCLQNKRGSSNMGPNEKQKIEIDQLHWAPLPPLDQAVTADYSDFLGTAQLQTPSCEGAGCPFTGAAFLVHAMPGTELSRVRTELDPLCIFPTVPPHPVHPNRELLCFWSCANMGPIKEIL